MVSDLILKLLYIQGARTGYQLIESIRLPFEIVDSLLLDLQQRRFIEVRSTNGPSRTGYTFDLTMAGRDRAREALATNQYAGPAPVPLARYREWVELQSVRWTRVTRERVRAAFQDLVLADRLFEMLGPAVNSAGSLFIHGPPGNGKTRIAELIARLLGEEAVYIPYAVEIDGQVMVLYDPVHHRPQSGAPPLETGDTRHDVLLRHQGDQADQRYARVARPVVAAGGELTLEQLDLQYDPNTKLYRAPFQVKANGGVLIIDDFGRQRIPPHELLNRWIVPLERRLDYLTLHTGMKFPVPFDCMVIFATNLDPIELVDEAFLRRIHYKVEVPNPLRDEFEIIFERECLARGIPFDPRAVEYLYRRHYDLRGTPPRGCHPRDILRHLESIARYHECEPTLSEELLEQSCRSYFLAMNGGETQQTTGMET
jgi:predicted ATPase with chaperone activity